MTRTDFCLRSCFPEYVCWSWSSYLARIISAYSNLLSTVLRDVYSRSRSKLTKFKVLCTLWVIACYNLRFKVIGSWINSLSWSSGTSGVVIRFLLKVCEPIRESLRSWKASLIEMTLVLGASYAFLSGSLVWLFTIGFFMTPNRWANLSSSSCSFSIPCLISFLT